MAVVWRERASLGARTSAMVMVVLFLLSCAPRPVYRKPAVAKPPAAAAKPLPPPPAPSEQARRPLPENPKIAEQDLKPSEQPIPPPLAAPKESPPSTALEPLPEAVLPLADDSSLLAKIGPATPPQRAASLRMSEEARKLLDGGDYARALGRLERAIAVDSTNAYGYFLLARAQYGLTRFKESLNFLDVAESRLGAEPFWLAEVHALRGENYRALGMIERAEASYHKALGINSGNRTAAEALAQMQAEPQSLQR